MFSGSRSIIIRTLLGYHRKRVRLVPAARHPTCVTNGSPSSAFLIKHSSSTSKSDNLWKMPSSYDYPNPRRDDSVVEEHFEQKVGDPYRWMEDPDSDETKAFVDAQNAVSRPYIRECEEREKISKELTDLWDYPKYGCPHKEGARYFFSKNSGLQNQSVMYKQETLKSDPEVFLDPNALSDDGTISLAVNAFSEDGTIFAYGLSKSGSDWFEVHFKNVETGENYPEVLKKLKFSGLTWTHDNKGIFYSAYHGHGAGDPEGKRSEGTDPTGLKHHKLYYHVVGTEQDKDVVVAEFPDEPKWLLHGGVSDCGRYLFVFPQKGCHGNLVYFCDLEKHGGAIEGKLPLTQIVFEFEYDFQYITTTGTRAVFRTDRGAPNYCLLSIDLDSPHYTNWTTLIGEHDRNVLEWAACVSKDRLVTCYMVDVKNALKVFDLATGLYQFDFPLDIGSVVGFSGEKKHSELFYKFSSMITPGIIYRVDMSKGDPPKAELFLSTEIKGLDPSQYTVEQVFFPSRDKTMVPMFIASRKDEKRDGSAACLLYGYGGFNISLTPCFSITQLFFVQHFGYLAIPNIRGGGEYGEKWHKGGCLLNKQNGFDDFAAAAEYLVANDYTRAGKLAIKGGSNGGLLVGACANQKPELFGAGVAAVGVMDMLRFHKFTIGHAWCSDYGNPDEKDHFENLSKFSPLHNIRAPANSEVQYPAMLLTTADHDDRVVPSHSLKYIAELQNTMRGVEKQTNPLMIRVDTKSGHGHGKPTSKTIEEITDVYSFLVRSLNLEYKK